MKTAYIVIALIVVVGGILLFTGGSNETGAPTSGEEAMMEKEKEDAMMDKKEDVMKDKEEGAMMEAIVVSYTDEGFSPSAITIKKGEKVTFKNISSAPMWPASAQHPTHKVYPGSGIEKCGTDEALNIFDACAPINSEGSYTFTFNETGEWKYHDHLKLGNFGSVTVE